VFLRAHNCCRMSAACQSSCSKISFSCCFQASLVVQTQGYADWSGPPASPIRHAAECTPTLCPAWMVHWPSSGLALCRLGRVPGRAWLISLPLLFFLLEYYKHKGKAMYCMPASLYSAETQTIHNSFHGPGSFILDLAALSVLVSK
jgi:hypothetical protein